MTAAVSWSATIVTSLEHMDVFERAFNDLTSIVSQYEVEEDKLWAVEGLFIDAPPRDELVKRIALAAQALSIAEPELVIAKIPQKDWLTESVASFQPLRAGRFYIHGDHIPRPYPPGAIRLKLNAATAFGSGEHASTRGCLLALDGLRARNYCFTRALDMGCGTAILALAMAKAWHRPVLAADIDPEAVRVARLNARQNGAGALVHAVLSDATGNRDVLAGAPYGLITANILARPLMAMAADLTSLLAHGGYLILAGLLTRQEAMVLTAYRMQGLRLSRRYRLKPWSTLVLKR